MHGLPALGIDVGGGSAKIGLVAPDGTVIARTQVVSNPALEGGALLDSYLNAAFALQAEIKATKLAGIGIGLPGQIDTAAGTTYVGNVASLDGFPIVGHVRARTGLNAAIENDATLAAFAEHRHGAGRGSRRFLTVTLGTGIGVGFIEDGKAVHTSNGTLGDIGHVIVDPSGTRTCRQGCHGCLESVASGLALAESFRGLGGSEPGSDGIAPLFARAAQGNAQCLHIIDQAARFIAAGIVTWTHIFAPDRIAFAGGVSAAGPVLGDRIVAAIRGLIMPPYLANLTFVAAELGNDAGLVGAAAFGRGQSSTEQLVA